METTIAPTTMASHGTRKMVISGQEITTCSIGSLRGRVIYDDRSPFGGSEARSFVVIATSGGLRSLSRPPKEEGVRSI